MSITKLQLRTRVLKLLDAESTSRWEITENGEVDRIIGAAQDREWHRILSASPYYLIKRKSITIYSTGTSLFSDLVDGGADTIIRPFRIQSLSVDGTVYEEVNPEDFILPAGGTSAPNPMYIWYLEGDTIRMFPIQITSSPLVVYNYLPVRQENLANSSSVVLFPEGYEDILTYASAARLLTKGGAETEAARYFSLQAEELRQEMLQDIARRTMKPTGFKYNDDRSDWAG